jgi:uncharacterized protein (DUF302 family)
MSLMNDLMFTVHESKLGFEETVASIKAAAEENGWEIPMVHDLQQTYQEAGHEEMTKVKIIYFCNPHGGYSILKEDKNKPMSVMMPTGVSVYETNRGQVYVAGMNLGRMSMMYGGTIKAVLQEGAVNFEKTIQNVAEPTKVEATDCKKHGGRCCLGCASLAVLLGALVALIAAIFMKVMPIIMPKMMTKMMGAMEEAGVQPPCAKIILEHLDSERQNK